MTVQEQRCHIWKNTTDIIDTNMLYISPNKNTNRLDEADKLESRIKEESHISAWHAVWKVLPLIITVNSQRNYFGVEEAKSIIFDKLSLGYQLDVRGRMSRWWVNIWVYSKYLNRDDSLRYKREINQFIDHIQTMKLVQVLQESMGRKWAHE